MRHLPTVSLQPAGMQINQPVAQAPPLDCGHTTLPVHTLPPCRPRLLGYKGRHLSGDDPGGAAALAGAGELDAMTGGGDDGAVDVDEELALGAACTFSKAVSTHWGGARVCVRDGEIEERGLGAARGDMNAARLGTGPQVCGAVSSCPV